MADYRLRRSTDDTPDPDFWEPDTGGSLPAGFDVDDNATLTQTPVDQTGDSPFINLVYDPAQLVDESNLGAVISARPTGSDAGDDAEVFGVTVNEMTYRAAENEGGASFQVETFDHPASSIGLAVQDEATITLSREAGGDPVTIASNGTVVFPRLPTADPHVAGQIWANSGALTVSAG